MKSLTIVTAMVTLFFSCAKKDIFTPLPPIDTDQSSESQQGTVLTPRGFITSTSTAADHIIFVWFENKYYTDVIGNTSQAPYINSLISKATLMTNMYGVTHPSQPNYLAMFSGSTQGVTSDVCMTNKPFSTLNLYTVLRKVSKRFAWYSEDLPNMGAVVCSYNNYYQKHNPTAVFKNVADSANKPLTMFNWGDTSSSNMKKLETVVCISPNNLHSMHGTTPYQGDQWLKSIFSKLIYWCQHHNSIFVIYFDESDNSSSNKLPVMLLGYHIKQNFKLSTTYNHYSFTKYLAHTYNADSTYNSNLKAAKGVTGFYH